MDTEKEILVDKVIEQIKNDLTRNIETGYTHEEFVRDLLRLVDDNLLNEYLNY